MLNNELMQVTMKMCSREEEKVIDEYMVTVFYKALDFV